MQPPVLQVDVQEATAILRLNRPDVHNAVNEAVMQRLEEVLDELDSRPEVRAVILTGAGPTTFCAGGDLRYFATLTTRAACLEMSRRMQTILDRLYYGDRVVIAAVNGQALGGGCEILTACHFRLAAEQATFAFRQAPNGIITGWGGGRRLFRLIGRSQALRLLLTGERIDAAEALCIGLVEQVVPADQLLSDAKALADSIVRHAPEAVTAFLKLARAVEEASPEEVAELETRLFTDLWMQPPFQEFLRKFK